jgi:hypothetical protein
MNAQIMKEDGVSVRCLKGGVALVRLRKTLVHELDGEAAVVFDLRRPRGEFSLS